MRVRPQVWVLCVVVTAYPACGGGFADVPGPFNPHDSSRIYLYNYPNPFQSRTTIDFYTPERGRVVVSVHDLKGSLLFRLVDREIGKGAYSLYWSIRGLAGGMYLYRLTTPQASITRKLTIIR